DDPERARGLDETVACGLRLERIVRGADLEPRVRGDERSHALCELRMRVEAGADGGAAERNLAQPPERPLDPRLALAHLRCIAPELLAERHGHRVHPVGPARLDDIVELASLRLEGLR